VKELTFGAGGGAQVQAPAQAVVPAPAAPQPAQAVTVPAGTILHVRMQDSLDTKRHGNGHRFTAVMEADIAVSGVVVIPRGAKVYGQVTNAKQAGHLVGKSGATLIFTGVMINNQIKPIHSGQIQAANEKGSGRQTVRRTATGAVIGGLVDGRDGAKTGAAIGLGLSLLTRGNSLQIPSGTLLDVSLAAPFAP
jgi:polygalacturonase